MMGVAVHLAAAVVDPAVAWALCVIAVLIIMIIAVAWKDR